tara:strand:+ start:788 stop:1753 length:966 start_codon:yes stop_codon:yes gene_type:complete
MAKEDLRKLRSDKPTGEYPWWDGKVKDPVKLHVSLPIYDSKIPIPQDAAMKQALTNTILGEKLEAEFNYVAGDSLVCRARDKLAAAFMQSDCEWQLQIDSDIIFPNGMGQDLAQYYANWMDTDTFNLFLGEGVFRLALSMNAIDEILRSGIQDGKKIVGGYYFWRGGMKNFNEAGSLFDGTDEKWEIEFKLRPDNYIKTDRLATGFLLIHRSVYEAMDKKYPELSYDLPSVYPNIPTMAYYTPIVTQETINGKKQNFYRSEDYALGYRAKECGFEPCLNMNLLLGHKGSTIYSWFDRPPLQKLLIQNFDNPKHFIEKKDDK